MPNFTFVTPSVIIARNAGALYGVKLGNGSMPAYTTMAGATVATQEALLNGVYTNSVGTASPSAVADTLIANLGITGTAAIATAQAYVIAQLNGATVATRGAIVNSILNAFSNLTADATFGAAATAWNAKIADALFYASTPGNADVAFGTTNFSLTTATDNITGTAGDDVFNAIILNNSNTLQSGDALNGGAGNDTLNADLGSSASFAITPNLVSIEKVSIRAEATQIDPTNGNNTSGQGGVIIDAQRSASVTTWESSNSRSDVIIEDVRTNSNVTTVSFVESDPGNVDLGVYFNERNLVNTNSSQSSLNILVMDVAAANAAATAATPLLNINFNSFTFFSNNAQVVLGGQGTPAGTAIDNSTTYAQLLAAFQLALKTASVAGVITDLSAIVTASLSSVQNMSTAAAADKASAPVAASFLNLNGQILTLSTNSAATITSANAAGVAGGWSASGPAPTTGAIAQTMNSGGSSSQVLVSTSIILDDVGMGDTGGDLVVGGMSTGITSNDMGVQLFNIEVRDNSKLQTINSTNNTLREVYITNGVTTSTSTAYVTTVKDKGDLTVNGTNFVNPNINNVNGTTTAPVYAVDINLEGTNGILGTNQTVNHSGNGAAGFTDVRVIDASAMTGKFAFTAAITSDSIAKYINLVDTQANPAGDVATANTVGKGANFIYTGGTNNDTMVVSIDAGVASSRSTTVSGQSDFTFNINGGAGDDNITVRVNDNALKGGAQAWYTNQKLNANITIDAGDGNDTIRTPGAGDKIILAGAGNDTVYTDNTGALASANATGTAGTAAVAYANAAAAELAAGQAAAALANSTALVNVLDPSAAATAVVTNLAVLDALTPDNLTVVPVYQSYAIVGAGIAAAYTANAITAAQKIALDTAYKITTTAETEVLPVALATQSTFAGLTLNVANAGVMIATEAAAGDAVLAAIVATARGNVATATAANANLITQAALLNPTQTAVVTATQAMNGVYNGDTAAAAGTTTIVNGLTALKNAFVVGATVEKQIAALNAADKAGIIVATVDDAAILAVNGGATLVAATAAATQALIQPFLDTAIVNNAAAQVLLTAAIAADVKVENAISVAVGLAPAGASATPNFSGTFGDAAALTLATTAAKLAAVNLADAKAVDVALLGLKAAVSTSTLDVAVNTALYLAAGATAAAALDSVTNGTGAVVDPLAGSIVGGVVVGGSVVAGLQGFAGVAAGADGVLNTEKVAFDTGAGGYLAAGSVDSLLVANNAQIASLTIASANAAKLVTDTQTALTIATAAANSGATSLTLAAPTAVFVFNTSNQSASYNPSTMDDRNLADLRSDAEAHNAYNFANTTVKVSYKGIDASAVVAGTNNATTTDLQINQGLKMAINSDAVLSKLLLATDGPGNTLVVTSLIDGTHTTADLAVSITLPAGADAAANTALALFNTTGDYKAQFAESGAAAANLTLTGTNSLASTDNIITGGTGNDVIVLSTTVGTDVLTSSNETLVYAPGFGNDTVVNFAIASSLGTDKLDFSALNGRGAQFGITNADTSIVIGAVGTNALSATAIAALFTDSATAINHVYVAVDSTNIGTVYTVADAAGTAAGNVVATIVGTIDLASTAWGTLGAANFA